NVNGDVIAVVLDGGGLVAGQDLYAQLLVLLRNLLGNSLILIRKNAVHELHDGNVHTVVSQHISKLHTDGASANDNHGIWRFPIENLLFVRNDVATDFHARQGAHYRAGSNDGVVKGNGLTLIIAFGNFEGLCVLEGSQTVDLGNLVLLHQVANALDDPLGDLTGALVRCTEVKAHITGDTKVLGLMVEGVCHLGVLKQCLGWDTAHVQANTAPVLLFYNCDFLAQLCCTNGGHVATRARTDYYYVIMFISHAY